MNTAKSKPVSGFPEVIMRLPEAGMPFKGVKAWIIQGEKQQLIFFEMESYALIPEHSHDYAQWGMVISGKMELTFGGKTRICGKGDEYVIPAHAKHSATFQTKTRVMDLFSEKSRYKAKSH